MTADDETAAKLATALMHIGATFLGPITEAVDGYRAQLTAQGYSPAAAETMALVYHELLFAYLRKHMGLSGRPK